MITHPDKVLFPADGITKGELAAYYDAIAPVMLPHICARPITLERYPSGIGKQGFMHKDVSKGFPEWPGAPVSAPCTWEELERGPVTPRTFTLRTMPSRVSDVGDLWSDMRGGALGRPMERLRLIILARAKG